MNSLNPFSVDFLDTIAAPNENFTAFKNLLQNITRDVKNLEKFYATQGIHTPFELEVDEEIISTGSLDLETGESRNVIAKLITCIAWQQHEGHGFRLMVNVKQERGIFQQIGPEMGFGDYNFRSTVLSSNPILESKADKLIQTHSRLRTFHEAMKETFKINS